MAVPTQSEARRSSAPLLSPKWARPRGDEDTGQRQTSLLYLSQRRRAVTELSHALAQCSTVLSAAELLWMAAQMEARLWQRAQAQAQAEAGGHATAQICTVPGHPQPPTAIGVYSGWVSQLLEGLRNAAATEVAAVTGTSMRSGQGLASAGAVAKAEAHLDLSVYPFPLDGPAQAASRQTAHAPTTISVEARGTESTLNAALEPGGRASSRGNWGQQKCMGHLPLGEGVPATLEGSHHTEMVPKGGDWLQDVRSRYLEPLRLCQLALEATLKAKEGSPAPAEEAESKRKSVPTSSSPLPSMPLLLSPSVPLQLDALSPPPARLPALHERSALSSFLRLVHGLVLFLSSPLPRAQLPKPNLMRLEGEVLQLLALLAGKTASRGGIGMPSEHKHVILRAVQAGLGSAVVMPGIGAGTGAQKLSEQHKRLRESQFWSVDGAERSQRRRTIEAAAAGGSFLHGNLLRRKADAGEQESKTMQRVDYETAVYGLGKGHGTEGSVSSKAPNKTSLAG